MFFGRKSLMSGRILLLALLGLPLLGCTAHTEAREDHKACVREGFPPDTYEFDKCMERRALHRDKEEDAL
jgi:hypothetical protein